MAFAQYALGPPQRGEQVLVPREMLEALLDKYEYDDDNEYHHGVGDAMMFKDPFMKTDETLYVPENFQNYFPEYTLEVDFERRKRHRNAFGECPYYNQESARIINRRMRDINAFGKKRKRKAKTKRRGVYKESRYEN